MNWQLDEVPSIFNFTHTDYVSERVKRSIFLPTRMLRALCVVYFFAFGFFWKITVMTTKQQWESPPVFSDFPVESVHGNQVTNKTLDRDTTQCLWANEQQGDEPGMQLCAAA